MRKRSKRIPADLTRLLTYLLILPALGLWAAAEGSSQDGYIQLSGPAGLEIFMDGDSQGVTDVALGGLIIQDVPAGEHRIKAMLEGHRAQSFGITVLPGKVTRLALAEPVALDRQDAPREGGGTLIIQTLPIEAELTIPGIPGGRDGTWSKIRDEWTSENVVPGTYEVSCHALGKTLNATIEIEEGKTSHWFFDFVDGDVADVGSEPTPPVAVQTAVKAQPADLSADDASEPVIPEGEVVWSGRLELKGKSMFQKIPLMDDRIVIFLHGSRRDRTRSLTLYEDRDAPTRSHMTLLKWTFRNQDTILWGAQLRAGSRARDAEGLDEFQFKGQDFSIRWKSWEEGGRLKGYDVADVTISRI